MNTYKLTSKAKPKLTEKGGDTQAERLYQVMLELGEEPVTLAQIVKQCEYRRYQSLLKTEPSIEASIVYHLKRWVKAGIVTSSS